MSTNFYAKITIPSDLMDVGLKIHLGKTGGGITLSGTWFRSWSTMKEFLEFNEDKLVILDEYGSELDLVELADRFENFDMAARRKQFDWLENNDSAGVGHWLDADGFTFMQGWFS